MKAEDILKESGWRHERERLKVDNKPEQFSTDYVSIDMDEDSVWLSTDDATIVFDKQQWDDFTNLIRGQGI